MIKRMTLLQRRDAMPFADFDAHWSGAHADIVRQLPRVARYNQNPVRRLLGDDEHKVDGIVELWFEDPTAMQAAFAVPAAARLPEDEPNFLSGITILSVREEVLTDGAATEKIMAIVDVAEADGSKLKALTTALAVDPAITRLVVNHVETVGSRSGLRAQPMAPVFVVETGGNDAAALETSFLAALSSLGAARASAYAVAERRVV